MPRIPDSPEQVFEMVILPLTRGQTALVDSADVPLLRPYSWCATGDGYAIARMRGHNRNVLMHRFILGLIDPLIEVDHWNCDGTDNRRSNLRIATRLENSRNTRKRSDARTSQFKGVFWDRALNKWRAGVNVNGRKLHLGVFDTEIDAAAAYNTFASDNFGAFARLNNLP